MDLMKQLVIGMQSSGASYVTFMLAQARPCVAVIDLYCEQPAPQLIEESLAHDVILKCTITANIPIEEQIARFSPDNIVLVTRSVVDISRSLNKKRWRDHGGTMEDKIQVYQDILLKRLH